MVDDLKEIRRWSKEKRQARLSVLHQSLASGVSRGDSQEEGSAHTQMLDECVVILLEVLREVISEKEWTDASALGMFEGVYAGLSENPIYGRVMQRSRDTLALVERFNGGSADEKSRLRSKLVARGLL